MRFEEQKPNLSVCWLGQSVEEGRTLTYRDEIQGGVGGGQGQVSGNPGGGILKRPAK